MAARRAAVVARSRSRALRRRRTAALRYAGGELILTVFEKRLPDSIEKQPFKKILDVAYVKRVIEEADGIQPHLVAPEAGYRRLLEEALGYLKDPTEKSVEEVGARGGWGGGWAGQGLGRCRGWGAAERCHAGCSCRRLQACCRFPPRTRPRPHPPQVFVLLRRMVDNIANADEVRALRRYPTLRREIVTAAYSALERFKEETRRMVGIMVEMERNYITAEYFRTIQVGAAAVCVCV